MSLNSRSNGQMSIRFTINIGSTVWSPPSPPRLSTRGTRGAWGAVRTPDKLRRAPLSDPGVRPDRVASARRLCADPSFPSREDLLRASRALATTLLTGLDPLS